jgi:hypothetical protein
MSERKDFVYDGHVALKLSSSQDQAKVRVAPPVQEILVTEIQHMIPINVACELDGEPSILTAYIDYTTNRVHIPSETTRELRGSDDLFREAIMNYLVYRNAEAVRRHEEMYPPQEMPEDYQVPEAPEVILEPACPNPAE